MEPIWRLADELGLRIITDPYWRGEPGATYSEINSELGVMLMPAVLPIRLERWLIAHELGHHVNPGYRRPTWLSEAKADRWAVRKLLELYDPEEVDWPERLFRAKKLEESLLAA